MHCLNLGIEEDQTQNVLWRIENGELDNIKPKVVVLSVGFNNTHHTPEEVVEGLQACEAAIRKHQPHANVVVIELFPSGPQPNPLRERVAMINQQLREASWGPITQVVNLDPGFVQADGTISHHDMYDYQHLTRNATMRTFEPLADLLGQLLSEQQLNDAPSQ
ncbi:PAFAH1B2 [Cordylochernes scorpioides]|uniref:PAFAH1B2 n=1 Tax=Cordylochernes scorpioides TaxID=51811 RepID=A0ABY6KRQ1_9ARAC|nr:PAFAH1B2 [Cordylochernes scorpioides]